MNHSDIFEEYAKIALAEGLIQDRKENHLEKNLDVKKERKFTSRKDLDNFKELYDEKLYNLKPEQEYKYKENISESAHKKTQNLIPSYGDNGIVENLNEAHEIILEKVQKTPNATLLQFVKAENELLTELIRIADYLELNNETSLVKIADTCINQLDAKVKSKKKNIKKSSYDVVITKKAAAPAAAAALGPAAIVGLGLAGAAAIYGIIYAYNNISIDRGTIQNFDSAKKELTEVLNSNESSSLEQSVRTAISRLEDLKAKFINHNNTTLKDKTFMTEEELDKYKETNEFKKALEDLKELNKLVSVSRQQFKVLVQQLYALHESSDYYESDAGRFSSKWWSNLGRDVGKIFNTSGPKDAALALENVCNSLNKFLVNQSSQLKSGEQKAKENVIEDTGSKNLLDNVTNVVTNKAKDLFNTDSNKGTEDNSKSPAFDFSFMNKK